MVSIVVLGLLLLATLVTLAATGRDVAMDGEAFHVSRWWTLLPLLLLLVSLFGFTFTTVSPRSEGVVQTFGHVDLDSTLPPGPHFTLPWSSVTEIDATSKADVFNLDKGEGADNDDTTHEHGNISVRLADNGVASAKATLNWHPCEGAASRIFSTFRISDGDHADNPVEKMRDNLVVPKFRAAVLAALGGYNPTQPIDDIVVDPDNVQATIDALKKVNLAPDFKALSDAAEAEMVALLGKDPLVCVEDAQVSYLSLPDSTQERINAVLSEVNKARQALAQQVTNTAQAAANDIISASLAKNPLVIVKQCFDMIADGSFKPPAGFSCYGAPGLPVVATTPAE